MLAYIINLLMVTIIVTCNYLITNINTNTRDLAYQFISGFNPNFNLIKLMLFSAPAVVGLTR